MCIQDHKSCQTTKVKIPYELKMKFMMLEGLTLTSEFKFDKAKTSEGTFIYPIESKQPAVLMDLSHNCICFNACKEWYLNPVKRDLGPFKGLFPSSLDCNGMVEFHFDDVDLDRKEWRDWFIKED